MTQRLELPEGGAVNEHDGCCARGCATEKGCRQVAWRSGWAVVGRRPQGGTTVSHGGMTTATW
ncbi:hypothetical protein SESBI_03607 [Sesbania bispinosa]|nr:hypothetical protein SESBI_03607 [Sesbania bispinosa]